MTSKSVWTLLLSLGILYQCGANAQAAEGCGDLTPLECLQALSQPAGKRAPPDKTFNPRLAPNLDWLWNSQEANEPTCKLKNIYTMIPDDCRLELLQILHLFVTHSDY